MRHHAIASPAGRRPPRRRSLQLAVAAGLCALLPLAALAVELNDVRVGRTDERTRIVLESDQPIRFSLFAVRYPDRFLLDLEGIEQEADLAALAGRIGADHPYIRSLHIVRGTGITTLELVLADDLAPQIFTLQPQSGFGHRLVLDIFAPGEVPPAVLHQPAPVSRQAQAPAPPEPVLEVAPTPAPAPSAPAPPEIPAAPPLAQPAPPPLPARPAAPSGAVPQETWVAVRINGEVQGGTVLALQRGGSWLLRTEDLRRWRLRLPEGQPVLHAGDPFQPLDAFRGLSYQLDEATQTLLLEAGPGLFQGTLLGGLNTPGLSSPSPPSPGAAINYELQASGDGDDRRLDGTLEALGFGPWGNLHGTFVGRDLSGDSELIRLETTWTRDLPERMASLRLGDTISGSGLVARPVRMGGVQWATNFATQPGFITFPLPGMAGEAALPSVLELYVNGALRSREQVPTGPFSIEHLPVVTGQGEALLVVRDLLGRERIIRQPFHVSATLLQPGLDQYSYTLGAIRENFGLASNDYGRVAALGTHRRGLSDWFTGEVHAELLDGQQTLGLGATLLWRDIGIWQLAASRSHGPRGDGGRVGLGFERQGRVISLGLNAEYASAAFTQIGLDPDRPAPRLIGRGFAGLNLGEAGSLGLTYAVQDQRQGDDLEQAGLHYNVDLGDFAFLNVSLLRLLGEDPETQLGLNLAFPLGGSRHVSLGYERQDGDGTSRLQMQRSPPLGSGYGYRLLATLGDTQRLDAGLVLQNQVGRYLLDVAHSDQQTAWRGSASGGLALLGGGVFPTRQIEDSFAVVQVPGYEGVRVYADNHEVARTDAEGNALVPTLRAYEHNPLRIEQADLPLDAEIASLQADAVPYARSGTVVRFPVQRVRGALLTVLQDNGEPVPPGAVARVSGRGEEFPVGYDGQLYLTGLDDRSEVRLEWPGAACSLVLEPVTSDAPVAELGTHTCRRETP